MKSSDLLIYMFLIYLLLKLAEGESRTSEEDNWDCQSQDLMWNYPPPQKKRGKNNR